MNSPDPVQPNAQSTKSQSIEDLFRSLRKARTQVVLCEDRLSEERAAQSTNAGNTLLASHTTEKIALLETQHAHAVAEVQKLEHIAEHLANSIESERLARVFRFRMIREMSADEVSRITGYSRRTVNRDLEKALAALKANLPLGINCNSGADVSCPHPSPDARDCT